MTEPTIHQIEKLLESFRLNGGSDAEITALAQDIIRDFRPELLKDPSEIFGGDKHESINKITAFKNDGKKPLKQAAEDYWHRWYVKYPFTLLVVFFVIFMISNAPLYWNKIQPTKVAAKEPAAKIASSTKIETSAPLEAGETIPSSPTLVVPKISVTAPIIFLNTTEESVQQANLPNGVIHYYQTALPGQVGNTFITGHSSNYWWVKGSYNYIFANLDKLVVGDQAKIYYNGKKYLYQVKSVKIVEPTDMSVLDQSIKPTLTLMTCTPPGTSWKRLIVTFDQISPAYKSRLVTKDSKNNQKVTTATTLPRTDSNAFVDWLISLFTPSTASNNK